MIKVAIIVFGMMIFHHNNVHKTCAHKTCVHNHCSQHKPCEHKTCEHKTMVPDLKEHNVLNVLNEVSEGIKSKCLNGRCNIQKKDEVKK